MNLERYLNKFHLFGLFYITGINPCMSVRCSLGEECAINKFGIAQCQCPSNCEPMMRPVCSKDGKTFASECELKRTACLGKTSIEMAYTGICGERGTHLNMIHTFVIENIGYCVCRYFISELSSSISNIHKQHTINSAI